VKSSTKALSPAVCHRKTRNRGETSI
jgi:hypothetical protein